MDPYTGLSMVQDQIAANNSWNAEQAQKQMDFQERMSNTAHAREVADLKASGLNPVLSAKLGGASTPSGAMAQSDPSATSALVNMIDRLIDITQTQANGNYYSAKGNADAEEKELTDAERGGIWSWIFSGRDSRDSRAGLGKVMSQAYDNVKSKVKAVVNWFNGKPADYDMTWSEAWNNAKNGAKILGGYVGSAFNNAKTSLNNWIQDVSTEGIKLPYDKYIYSSLRHKPGYFAGNNYPHIYPKKTLKESKADLRQGLEAPDPYKRYGSGRKRTRQKQ